MTTSQVSHKCTNGRKLDQGVTTACRKTSNIQGRIVSNGIVGNRSSNVKSNDPTTGRISTLLKRNDSGVDSYRNVDEQKIKKTISPHVTGRTSNFHNSHIQTTVVDSGTSHDNTKPRYYGTKLKNDQASGDCKVATSNNHDYKSSCNIATSSVPPFRYPSQPMTKIPHRDPISISQHARPPPRNDSAALAVSRKPFDQRCNIVGKMTPTNFPPLRAPQSIVDVRHPFVTESRTKHSDVGMLSCKPKTDGNPLSSGIKELTYTRHTYHGYGTASTMTGMPSIPNLPNIGTNISPYVRSDSYGQARVANVVYPETPQFPQSPSFNAAQVGQYRAYEHSNYTATTPVNVNPVMPQYPTENSLPYQQYENSAQFMQTNHYATNDMTNSQYQYQAAGVGIIQESPLFLQNPISVADQYNAANYARAMRAELIPRLHQPPRFNK